MKLSARKNNKGYMTSYSVTIGCAEARIAGLLNEDGTSKEIEKIVDVEHNQIIFRLRQEETAEAPKYITLTEYAEKHQSDESVILKMVLDGRLPAIQKGDIRLIPADESLPSDRRIKSGKYIKNTEGAE